MYFFKFILCGGRTLVQENGMHRKCLNDHKIEITSCFMFPSVQKINPFPGEQIYSDKCI